MLFHVLINHFLFGGLGAQKNKSIFALAEQLGANVVKSICQYAGRHIWFFDVRHYSEDGGAVKILLGLNGGAPEPKPPKAFPKKP